MVRIRKLVLALVSLLTLALVGVPGAAQAEKRIALVIGNAGYQAGALNTPANDAGLIAQTLQAAGFDVVGARDLDQDTLRHAFRDFVEKASASGPDTVAFIYANGYAVQLEGENYFVPIDARIARDSDVAAEALRISDYTRPLADGPREARRKPSAADPTSSRGRKIRNTITSAGGESLDTLGGNYAGRRLIFANGPLKARETVSQREQHKAGRTDCALSGCNTRSVATPTGQP
jgi:hypothetical protein